MLRTRVKDEHLLVAKVPLEVGDIVSDGVLEAQSVVGISASLSGLHDLPAQGWEAEGSNTACGLANMKASCQPRSRKQQNEEKRVGRTAEAEDQRRCTAPTGRSDQVVSRAGPPSCTTRFS
jgi:hypothetical protein